MKCPLKFRLQGFEGGEKCDPECAWLVEAGEFPSITMRVCAMTLVGNTTECPRRPMNRYDQDGDMA